MGPDRYSYGTGMPMDTEARTLGALVKANVILSERHLLRVGAEYQSHVLYDFWPPVGGTMGPNTFWNVDYGQRQRIDAFAEWEARWTDAWLGQVGIRSDTVMTDAGPVQGYDDSLPAWGIDAAAFNASSRRRTDFNWDLSALARYTPDPTQTYEGGYARKSRSPNLYQRYPWSTNAMAALMNNLVGDGNGYVGLVGLDARGRPHRQRHRRLARRRPGALGREGHRATTPTSRTTSTRGAATSASAAPRT